jgi:hypothetical protein
MSTVELAAFLRVPERVASAVAAALQTVDAEQCCAALWKPSALLLCLDGASENREEEVTAGPGVKASAYCETSTVLTAASALIIFVGSERARRCAGIVGCLMCECVRCCFLCQKNYALADRLFDPTGPLWIFEEVLQYETAACSRHCCLQHCTGVGLHQRFFTELAECQSCSNPI